MSTRRSRRSARHSRAERIPLFKDLTWFTVGTALIIYQGFIVSPQDFNWIAMAFGGVVGGVPGAVQLWGLRGTTTSGTESSPSEPAAPPSLPQ